MGKYLLKRILFSIFSLLVVVMVVMLLVYTAINRNVIFQTDDLWNKKAGNDQKYYEYMQFQKFGYLNFVNYTDFLGNKYRAQLGDGYDDSEAFLADRNAIQSRDDSYKENPSVKEFYEQYDGKDSYKVIRLDPDTYKSGKLKPGGGAYLIAVRERNPLLRLFYYIRDFISFESTSDVEDPNLTERYVRFEKDPYSGLFAVVGSGTTHKYLLYFDGRFPFIHQNWAHLNLGTSYTKYRGQEISTVITTPAGELNVFRQQYPNLIGTDQYVETAIDFHSLTYNPMTREADRELFPDNYTSYSMHRTGLSMLENSFVIGLVATALAYLIGLPLGILMARRKDKLADKIGNFYIIFVIAVPSLAYIFMFAAFATKTFDLPYKFANAQTKFLAYVLPTISLALPWIGSLMKWMRRYMIDQMNSDYVKFARAEGLSEREIYRTHISRNAMIPIVHGIPGSILGCLTGALITERVYGVPGVGALLTTAINSHDNGIIVACTVFYTFLSIVSLILGDLLLAKYDPRISLSSERGGGR